MESSNGYFDVYPYEDEPDTDQCINNQLPLFEFEQFDATENKHDSLTSLWNEGSWNYEEIHKGLDSCHLGSNGIWSFDSADVQNSIEIEGSISDNDSLSCKCVVSEDISIVSPTNYVSDKKLSDNLKANSSQFDSQNTFEGTPSHQEFSKSATFLSWLLDTKDKLIEKQRLIDNGLTPKSGVGRKRKIGVFTSSQQLIDIKKHLKDEFVEVITTFKKNSKRNDQLMTNFSRKFRNLPKYLVKFSTKNKSKSSDMKEYTYSFLESFMAFRSYNDFGDRDFIQRFVEFSILYYSEQKVTDMMNQLLSDVKLGETNIWESDREPTQKSTLIG